MDAYGSFTTACRGEPVVPTLVSLLANMRNPPVAAEAVQHVVVLYQHFQSASHEVYLMDGQARFYCGLKTEAVLTGVFGMFGPPVPSVGHV